jgi:hypothetical protein
MPCLGRGCCPPNDRFGVKSSDRIVELGGHWVMDAGSSDAQEGGDRRELTIELQPLYHNLRDDLRLQIQGLIGPGVDIEFLVTPAGRLRLTLLGESRKLEEARWHIRGAALPDWLPRLIPRAGDPLSLRRMGRVVISSLAISIPLTYWWAWSVSAAAAGEFALSPEDIGLDSQSLLVRISPLPVLVGLLAAGIVLGESRLGGLIYDGDRIKAAVLRFVRMEWDYLGGILLAPFVILLSLAIAIDAPHWVAAILAVFGFLLAIGWIGAVVTLISSYFGEVEDYLPGYVTSDSGVRTPGSRTSSFRWRDDHERLRWWSRLLTSKVLAYALACVLIVLVLAVPYFSAKSAAQELRRGQEVEFSLPPNIPLLFFRHVAVTRTSGASAPVPDCPILLGSSPQGVLALWDAAHNRLWRESALAVSLVEPCDEDK